MSYATVQRLRPALLVAVTVFLLAGCAGSKNVTDVVDIGRSYLPLERTVPSPDSLVHLSVVQRPDSVVAQSQRSFEEVQQFWSVARQLPYFQEYVLRTGPTSRDLWDPDSYRRHNFASRSRRQAPDFPESFATLWSRELALASAAYEEKQEPLARDAERFQESIAREAVDRRLEEYHESLRFDVYFFRTWDRIETRLDLPGTHVVLRDESGKEYRPDSLHIGPLMESAISPRNTPVYYRRNTVYFDRSKVAGRRGGLRKLELWVWRVDQADLAFIWHIESPPRLSAQQ